MQENNQNSLNDSIVKGFLASIGSILTAAVIATFSSVQTTSLEIVRLQSRITSLNETVVTKDNAREAKLREITEKINDLQSKLSELEMEARQKNNEDDQKNNN